MDSRGQMEDNATLAVIKIGLPMIIYAIMRQHFRTHSRYTEGNSYNYKQPEISSSNTRFLEVRRHILHSSILFHVTLCHP